MRGKPFHNKIAQECREILTRYHWRVYMEHCIKADHITTYFDLYATNGSRNIACEIETTSRHALDNAAKAIVTDIPLWIIVPSRRLRRQIDHKLQAAQLTSNHCSIRVLLMSQLEAELIQFISIS